MLNKGRLSHNMYHSDTEQATFAIAEWLFHVYREGGALETLMTDALKYAKQAEDIGKPNGAMISNMIAQSCSNLRGLDNLDDPSRMTGTVLTEEKSKLYAELNVGMYEGIVDIRRAVVGTYAGQHILVAKMAVKQGLGYWDKFSYGNASNAWIEFLVGVSCFVAYQETKKRKYMKAGKFYLKRTRALHKAGYPNVKHYVSFLEAEAAALVKGKQQQARKLFELTILHSVRNGYIHDAALASERYGDFQRITLNDSYEAQYRYKEAIKYYEEWGATAKVKKIKGKFEIWMSSEFIREKQGMPSTSPSVKSWN